jgi:hypothetical protein
MDHDIEELIKHREIYFSALHPDPDQAASSMLLLSDIEGVIHLNKEGKRCLRISYDIRHLCLNMIEDALREVGFHLDNRLMCKLKRALYYYCEETQRANLGVDSHQCDCKKRIFIKQYQNTLHGCRDIRPEHWRHYR